MRQQRGREQSGKREEEVDNPNENFWGFLGTKKEQKYVSKSERPPDQPFLFCSVLFILKDFHNHPFRTFVLTASLLELIQPVEHFYLTQGRRSTMMGRATVVIAVRGCPDQLLELLDVQIFSGLERNLFQNLSS